MVKIPAEEEVKVKWIIGVYYTAFVAVIIYMVVDCILNHRYSELSTPVAFRSSWVVAPNRAWQGPHSEPYCLNAAFDWPLPPAHYKFEGPHNLTNVSCAWIPTSKMASFIVDGSFGLPTFFEVPRNDSFIPDPYFVTALEDVTYNTNHGFYHPTLGTVALPTTIVYDLHNNEIKRFDKGDILTLTYADLVRATGANLDATTTTLPNLGVADSTFRHTGLFVLTTFTYTNYEANDANEHVICRVRFNPVSDIWGVIETDADGVEYHGFKFVVASAGAIGAFDYYAFGIYILNTVVFLGIAEFFARQAFLFQKQVRKRCATWAEEVEEVDSDKEEGAAEESSAVEGKTAEEGGTLDPSGTTVVMIPHTPA
jgi:hypothetical protein